MSVSNAINLYNANILEQYASLESQNLAPQLAVYRENELVIYSQKITTVIDQIVQLFKDFLYFILNKCGVIKIDPERVKQLKASVENFYESKVSKAKIEEELKTVKLENAQLKAFAQKQNKIALDVIQKWKDSSLYYQSKYQEVTEAFTQLLGGIMVKALTATPGSPLYSPLNQATFGTAPWINPLSFKTSNPQSPEMVYKPIQEYKSETLQKGVLAPDASAASKQPSASTPITSPVPVTGSDKSVPPIDDLD